MARRSLGRIRSWFCRLPLSRWWVVLVSAVLAVWTVGLALLADEIRLSTLRAFIGPERGPPDYLVVGFWIALAAWIILLAVRLGADETVRAQRLDRVVGAIHHAPSTNPITKFREYIDETAEHLDVVALRDGESDTDRLSRVSDGIVLALGILETLAREFNRAEDHVVYGANVMLIETPDTDANLPDNMLARLRFFDTHSRSIASLAAVLYLPGDLIYLAEGKGRPVEESRIPMIALPVPWRTHDDSGVRLVLPGAPWALLTGAPSIYEDTARIADDCEDFDRWTRDRVREYFSREGEGKHIRSLVSFRIGSETKPVGVLNIDSDYPYLLGRSEEYYPTFYALVSPFLVMLREPVTEYARLARKLSRSGDAGGS